VFAGLSTGAAYLAARWEREQGRTTLFVAADTGHRYAGTVFARHEEAPPVDTFAPVAVSTLAELELPWSRMDWGRAPAP
jgi:cysteine synthase A